MLLAEYDYDTDIAVQRKEAFDDGISIGRNEGISLGAHEKAIETAKVLKSSGVEIKLIINSTGLSVEEIEKL